MIKQLRKKFILVAMGSMFLVLAVIVGVLLVANYVSTVQNADRILAMLAENEGRFPVFGKFRDFHGADPFRKDEAFRGMSEETPYETRFFSVRMNAVGEVVSVDTGRIAAVETAEAIAYAKEVSASGRQKGFCESYRFFNRAEEGGRRIIFVDCGRDMRDFRSLLWNSIVVSLSGMLAVFVLVLFFSKKVFAPVEEGYQKQRRFVTDASHELKTPLAIISANVDLLEMEGEEGQWTKSIRHQVARLKTLTEQMVTLSRMDEQQGVVMKEFGLSRALAEVAEGFMPLALEGNRRLNLELEEGVFYKGDEEKLRQMAGLLLDNALKYSEDGSEIRFHLKSYKKKGYKVQLTLWNAVEDDSGLAPGSQDRLFERFYRPDASRSSETGGSGIGLSIVKSIVELHRGRISAESADGRSILFTIYL